MKNKPLLIGGGIIGAIVIILVVGAVVIFSGLDGIIKAAVEDMGPKMTKTEVKLDKVETSLTEGSASLSGLMIGNPSGFNTPHAFKLGSISVKIDTGTITDQTIVINEININTPDVIAEFQKFSFNPLKASASIQEALKTSNFIAIQKNVEAAVAAQGGGSGGSGDAKDDGGKKGEGPKLIIEKFRMSNVKVRAVSQSGLKLDQSLPPISIAVDNIGKSEGGLTPEQVAGVLVPKVQDAVIKAITGDLTKLATDVFKSVGGAAGDAVKAVSEGVGGAVGGAASGAGDAVKGATDGIKKLFGN